MNGTRNPYDDDSSSDFDEFRRLKVKLEEERSEDEDESPQPPQQPQRKHFCVICEKQFSSGKAYGGHVRIHSTEYNNKGKTKKMKKKKKISLVRKEKEKEIDLIRADMEGKIRCCLCGKVFQTMHSLFGHMRRHPERSWKGIRPPSPLEKFKLSYLGDDEDIDDDDDVDVTSRSIMICDANKDVQEAAWTLMMIHYTSSINCSAGMKTALESPKSEVRSSSGYKGKANVFGDGRIDNKKDLIVDMKIKMETEGKINNPRDEAEKSLVFDLNQTLYHEDDPSPCWNYSSISRSME